MIRCAVMPPCAPGTRAPVKRQHPRPASTAACRLNVDGVLEGVAGEVERPRRFGQAVAVMPGFESNAVALWTGRALAGVAGRAAHRF